MATALRPEESGPCPLEDCRERLVDLEKAFRRMDKYAATLKEYSPPQAHPSGNPRADTAALGALLVEAVNGLRDITKCLIDVVEDLARKSD
jgi:hypothetical protein